MNSAVDWEMLDELRMLSYCSLPVVSILHYCVPVHVATVLCQNDARLRDEG